MFTRFFLIKSFFELNFFFENIIITLQFTNVMRKKFYIFILYRLISLIKLHHQLNNFKFNSIKKKIITMFITRIRFLRALNNDYDEK